MRIFCAGEDASTFVDPTGATWTPVGATTYEAQGATREVAGPTVANASGLSPIMTYECYGAVVQLMFPGMLRCAVLRCAVLCYMRHCPRLAICYTYAVRPCQQPGAHSDV